MTFRAHRLPFAWILFLAFLPSISFAGHWDIELAVPGAGFTLGFTPAHVHAAGRPEGSPPGHRDHCHTDASGCSDQPLVAGAQVANLGQMIALAPSLDEVRGFQPSRVLLPEGMATTPDIPPPRAS